MYKWKVMLVIHQQWFMIKNLIITGENELNEKTVMNSNKILWNIPLGTKGHVTSGQISVFNISCLQRHW